MGAGESRNERFYHLCGLGKSHLIERMLEMDKLHKTINVNWQSFESKCTPLLIASANGHEKVVEILLKNGADVTVRDERLNTALHHAAMRGRSSMIDQLIKAGCDVNALDKNKWSPLMCACYWGNPEGVVCLLEANADPQIRNADGRLALHELCRSPVRNEDLLAEIALTLIDSSSDVVDLTSSSEEDLTALMYSAYHNHPGVATVLIESNCNLNSQDNQGWTALHWSVDLDHAEIVQLLVDKGCHLNIKGNREELALDRAKSDYVKSILLKHANYIENSNKTSNNIITNDHQQQQQQQMLKITS